MVVHAEGASVDFGTVVQGSLQTRQIVLHNPAALPVSLVRIVTGCGCVSAHVAQQVVPANDFTTIEFIAEKPRRLGRLPAKECLIECSDGTQIRVSIDGYVRPTFEALLVEQDELRGVVLVSNGGEAFEHAGRSFAAPIDDQSVPFAVFVAMDADAYASLVQSKMVPIASESTQAISVQAPQPDALDIEPDSDGSCVIRVPSDQFSHNPPLLLIRRGPAWSVFQPEPNQLVSESPR